MLLTVIYKSNFSVGGVNIVTFFFGFGVSEPYGRYSSLLFGLEQESSVFRGIEKQPLSHWVVECSMSTISKMEMSTAALFPYLTSVFFRCYCLPDMSYLVLFV